MTMDKKKNTKRYYVDNDVFLQAMTDYRNSVIQAREAGLEKPMVSEYIGDCILKIAKNLAYLHKFINYTFRDDMISDAVENCIIYIDNFNPEKSKNPFGYFTKISYWAFVRRIEREKKQLRTKQKMIENMDVDSIIVQEHDNTEYMNSLLSYMQKYSDNNDVIAERVDRITKKIPAHVEDYEGAPLDQ